jgi:hypothetical protein
LTASVQIVLFIALRSQTSLGRGIFYAHVSVSRAKQVVASVPLFTTLMIFACRFEAKYCLWISPKNLRVCHAHINGTCTSGNATRVPIIVVANGFFTIQIFRSQMPKFLIFRGEHIFCNNFSSVSWFIQMWTQVVVLARLLEVAACNLVLKRTAIQAGAENVMGTLLQHFQIWTSIWGASLCLVARCSLPATLVLPFFCDAIYPGAGMGCEVLHGD